MVSLTKRHLTDLQYLAEMSLEFCHRTCFLIPAATRQQMNKRGKKQTRVSLHFARSSINFWLYVGYFAWSFDLISIWKQVLEVSENYGLL
jgi:hypothetical protein